MTISKTLANSYLIYGLYLTALFLFITVAKADSESCTKIETTKKSSWIEGAKYCQNNVLWIDLGKYVYVYKNVPNNDWQEFKLSSSLGLGFHKYIKSKYSHSERMNGTKGVNDINQSTHLRKS